jgi:hypothetical protein
LAYLLVFPPLPTPNVLADPVNPLKPANPSLSLNLNGVSSVDITNLAPNAPTKTSSITITTTTNNPAGYTTKISTNHATNTCLLRSTDSDCNSSGTPKISPVIGTLTASPNDLSILGVNQWGATKLTPTSPDDDDKIWFQIPDLDHPTIIDQDNDPTGTNNDGATGNHQNITFGSKVNYAIPAGSYSTTIVITAIANSYTDHPPTINSITPSSSNPAGNTEIVIAGTNFTYAYQVFIDLDKDGEQNPDDSENCFNANIDNDNQITCYTPVGAVGAYDVVVKTWGGVATKTNGFTYQDPAVCRSGYEIGNLCQIDLDANMIPVAYTGDATVPEWSKVSPTESNGGWYDYEQQKWANAVTVTTSTLNAYKNAAAGTVIPESDILGYWVYIPRYEYQVCRPNAINWSNDLTGDNCYDGLGNPVTDLSTPYNFNIKFQKNTQTTTYNGTTIGGWVTHPAFTIGSAELNGFWYGKFESSRSDNYYCYTYVSGDTCNNGATVAYIGTPLNTVSLYATVKPSKAPATYQRVANDYQSAEYIKTAHNLATTNSHISNNNHWGAATYLSTSIYGVDAAVSKVYNNGYYNSGVASNTNTAMRYQTGCGPAASQSNSSSTTCNQYHTSIGQQASTSGNVYGIYDMAGGIWEYQLAVLTCASDNQLSTGNSTSQNSGFSNGAGTANNCYNGSQSATQPTSNPTLWSDDKYLNIYQRYATFTNNNQYTNNNQCTWIACGGQALHETKTTQSVSSDNQSWGSDSSYFMDSSNSWFLRGEVANYGDSVGLFASNGSSGYAYRSIGWRAILGAY